MSILTILVSFLTCLTLLIIVRPIAVKFNLVDFPTKRKNHSGNIPLIGGICIFAAVLISHISVIEFSEFSCVLLFASSLILIQGIWDDFKNLKAKTKIIFQGFLTVIIIYITDVKLESLGDLFGLSYPIELGVLSIPITIIAVIGLTNAFNMIDGLDGSASSCVLIAIIGLLGFSLNTDISPINNTLLAIISASVPFMIFNIAPYQKMKVFLGDGGSLFLGFIISWVLIYSAENTNNFNPSFALWCVAIPLFDFFTVIIIRVLKKRPLMTAGTDHIHHALQNAGFSKLKILILTAFVGLFLLIVGKFIEDNLIHLSFPIFVILFLFYLYLRIYILPKKKKFNRY